MLTWLGYDEGLESASFATAETTTASASASATATPAPSAAPELPAAPAALRPRASFADVKGSFLQNLALQAGERSHGLGLRGHFNEAKAPGLSAVAVLDNGHGLNLAKDFELMPQIVFSEFARQIPNVNLHVVLLSTDWTLFGLPH
jgi:hypothetical protein